MEFGRRKVGGGMNVACKACHMMHHMFCDLGRCCQAFATGLSKINFLVSYAIVLVTEVNIFFLPYLGVLQQVHNVATVISLLEVVAYLSYISIQPSIINYMLTTVQKNVWLEFILILFYA